MKKVKCFMMMSLIITSSLLLFSGCDKKNRLHMDADKCAGAALEYLEEKYQTEFEVLDSREIMKYVGSAGYAEVTVKNKFEENEYIVRVYPNGSSDEDKDGYYDSYKVISDTYMCYILHDYVKDEIDRLLMEAGLTRVISSVSIQEGGDIAGFAGFSTDFPILGEGNFSFDDLLDDYGISIHCWLKIPESEKSDMLQNDITNIMKPLVSADDLITFSIDVYDDETYNEIEKLRKNKIGYNAMGNERISFFVEKEDKDEFK